MATTYTDSTFGARAIGARTNSAGGAVTDVNAEEDRYAHIHMGEGKLQVNSFQPVKGGAATFNVLFGSGTAKADYYVVAGNDAGQGNYVVRLDVTTQTVTINAADPTLDRIDEIYLVVQDNAYDASSRALPRLGYRDGTPAASPTAPGPDGGWDAYVLLATIDVPGAAADIVACTLTDERLESSFDVRDASVAGNLSVTGNITVTGTVDGIDVAGHTHTGGAGGTVDANNLSNLKAAVDAANVDADTVDGVHAAGFTLIAHHGGTATADHPEATTSVRGFMSAADKTKLDGIETAAKDDQTHTAGSGISITGEPNPTISHSDTSSASNMGPLTGANVISSVTVDGFGHVTAMAQRALTAGDIGAATSGHNHSGTYYTYEGATPSITISTAAASGGSNGDVWLKY